MAKGKRTIVFSSIEMFITLAVPFSIPIKEGEMRPLTTSTVILEQFKWLSQQVQVLMILVQSLQ